MNKRIERVLRRLRQGKPIESVEMQLIHTRVRDVAVTFCVNRDRDPIQRKHRKGMFYEPKELFELTDVFPEGGTFVDIGSNIGNHSLFAGLFLKAGRIIPIEPNPLAIELLLQNLIVNGLLDRVDLSHVGHGVSDVASGGFAMDDRPRNLGGAQMVEGAGDLRVERADVLLANDTPDFIKIDVEGMELKVLASLEGVLARCRPIILVEVDNPLADGFHDWVRAAGYGVVRSYKRYASNTNFMIADAARVEALNAKLPPADAEQEEPA